MSASGKLIGMGGNVTVASANYPVSEWSINVTNDVQDVTDTASGGWIASLEGVSGAEVTFRAWWGSSPSTLSTTFAIGASVAVTLNIGNQGTPQAVSGNVVISSFTITNNAKTTVEFQCTGKNNGTFTFPS